MSVERIYTDRFVIGSKHVKVNIEDGTSLTVTINGQEVQGEYCVWYEGEIEGDCALAQDDDHGAFCDVSLYVSYPMVVGALTLRKVAEITLDKFLHNRE